jgi:hypothetical protein
MNQAGLLLEFNAAVMAQRTGTAGSLVEMSVIAVGFYLVLAGNRRMAGRAAGNRLCLFIYSRKWRLEFMFLKRKTATIFSLSSQNFLLDP